MEFRRDGGGVIPVCMKEREFLWREMKGHHELPFENECCEMKDRGIIFVPPACGCGLQLTRQL